MHASKLVVKIDLQMQNKLICFREIRFWYSDKDKEEFVRNKWEVINNQTHLFKIFEYKTKFGYSSCLSACSAGNEVESLLLVVELSLGVVDGGGAGGGANEVQLGLGVVDGGGAHGGGDEGQLSVLVGLPLGRTFNLNLAMN